MAKTEGKTTTVCCKMPNGVLLRVFNMVGIVEPVMGGGTRESTRAEQTGPTVKVNGNAVPWGVIPAYKIIAGYAFTEGVDAEFFDKWLEQNKDSDMVKNKLIFAQAQDASAVSQSKEQAKVRSGLEPEDPANPRVKAVTPATDKVAA